MHRLLVAAAALTLLLALGSTALGGTGTLRGSVGPGFTISLTQGGKKVTKLKKGTYVLTVSDKASIHNFVIEGPGVERDVTTVPGTGTKTVTLKLRPGKYKFYCRPHESSMFGYVTVK